MGVPWWAVRVAAAGLVACGHAAGQTAAEPARPGAATPPMAPIAAAELDLGDPAPGLVVTQWIQGEEVEEFEPGMVYVLDFFATWAPGADEAARALSRLSTSMHGRVRVVGIASHNPGRGESGEQVAAYVERMGSAMRYTVAFDAHRVMFDRYMTAVGQAGVPHSFVIDGEGRLAWHGHPADPQLPAVADLVARGEWDTEAYGRLLEEQQRADALLVRAIEAWNAGERERTVGLLQEAFEINPSRFGHHAVWRFHALHVEMGESRRAYEYAKDLIEGALKDNADALADLAWVVVEAPAEREYDDIVAEWAARRALELTGEQHGHAWAAIAIIESRRQNFDEAMAAWERALMFVDDEFREGVYEQKRRETEVAREEALGGG